MAGWLTDAPLSASISFCCSSSALRCAANSSCCCWTKSCNCCKSVFGEGLAVLFGCAVAALSGDLDVDGSFALSAGTAPPALAMTGTARKSTAASKAVLTLCIHFLLVVSFSHSAHDSRLAENYFGPQLEALRHGSSKFVKRRQPLFGRCSRPSRGRSVWGAAQDLLVGSRAISQKSLKGK